MIYKRFFILLPLILFIGCASPLKQIKDPNKPFERPSYSVLPPPGDGWIYADQNQVGIFNLAFGKKFDSPTHTLSGLVVEIHSSAQFENPEEFLNYIKKSKELDADPRRFKMFEDEFNLDPKFGEYSVKYSSASEDYGAANKGNDPFLILKLYGYIFIHPNFENVIIDISYSERGKVSEIDPDFKTTAKKFIEGIKLKREE